MSCRAWADRWDSVAFGDSALRLTPRSAGRDDRWRLVHRLAASVNKEPPRGVISATATYETVLVEFDPSKVAHRSVLESMRLRDRLSAVEQQSDGATYVIPVLYGGAWGPDLDATAEVLHVSEESLVGAHVENAHVVRCLSHSAAPMMDGPLPGREVPRRPVPRVRVASGSVMLAGEQSMVLCADQPSGWQVIGRTPIRLVDAAGAGVLHRPGDIFRFRRIQPAGWDEACALSLAECREPG